MIENNNLNTGVIPTWCPGCNNFSVLAAVKKVLNEEISGDGGNKDKKKKKDDFAIVTGIGCHPKIFDYINLNGINTLHGRVLPTCLGIKIGNPNLTVLGFSGDGDAYAEGMEHLIHTARYNPNIKYFVLDNQVFALTVGQPTPTTEIGFKDKTTPQGVKIAPLNPIRLMLASNASFVARVYATNISEIEEVFREALKHKGFAFIEILSPCLIFHNQVEYKNKVYSLKEGRHDKTNFNEAIKRAEEFDYSTMNEDTKIPMGIFYQDPNSKNRIFEEQFEQLRDLKKKGIGWKDIER